MGHREQPSLTEKSPPKWEQGEEPSSPASGRPGQAQGWHVLGGSMPRWILLLQCFWASSSTSATLSASLHMSPAHSHYFPVTSSLIMNTSVILKQVPTRAQVGSYRSGGVSGGAEEEGRLGELETAWRTGSSTGGGLLLSSAQTH